MADTNKAYAVKGETLYNIAETIRNKRDIADEITVDDMAMQIGLISGGGGIQNGYIKFNDNISAFIGYYSGTSADIGSQYVFGSSSVIETQEAMQKDIEELKLSQNPLVASFVLSSQAERNEDDLIYAIQANTGINSAVSSGKRGCACYGKSTTSGVVTTAITQDFSSANVNSPHFGWTADNKLIWYRTSATQKFKGWMITIVIKEQYTYAPTT